MLVQNNQRVSEEVNDRGQSLGNVETTPPLSSLEPFGWLILQQFSWVSYFEQNIYLIYFRVISL